MANPLGYASTADEIWNAPIKDLTRLIVGYKVGPKTELAIAAINFRSAKRLERATWWLLSVTVLLLVATVVLVLKEAV